MHCSCGRASSSGLEQLLLPLEWGRGRLPSLRSLHSFLDKYNDFIEANRIEDSRERMKTLRKLVRTRGCLPWRAERPCPAGLSPCRVPTVALEKPFSSLGPVSPKSSRKWGLEGRFQPP